jgi:hypothetical protein
MVNISKKLYDNTSFYLTSLQRRMTFELIRKQLYADL